METCKLCNLENETKQLSHIVPKFFLQYIKENSPSKGLRMTSNVNLRVQDGVKKVFLCNECEIKLSKYEKCFADNVFYPFSNGKSIFVHNENDMEKIKKFIVSVIWRSVKYISLTDDAFYKDITSNEKEVIDSNIENWRNYLDSKEFIEINNVYLFPTVNLRGIENYYKNYDKNNVGILSRVFDEPNVHGMIYVKVPYFILVGITIGNLNEKYNSFLVKDKLTIDRQSIELPNTVNQLVCESIIEFYESRKNLNEKQKDGILKRANISN